MQKSLWSPNNPEMSFGNQPPYTEQITIGMDLRTRKLCVRSNAWIQPNHKIPNAKLLHPCSSPIKNKNEPLISPICFYLYCSSISWISYNRKARKYQGRTQLASNSIPIRIISPLQVPHTEAVISVSLLNCPLMSIFVDPSLMEIA